MSRYRMLIVIAASVAIAVALITIEKAGDERNGDQVLDEIDGLSGLEEDPTLLVGTDPLPGERVVATDPRWILVITPEQELMLRRPRSAATVSAYTRPVTLDEATAYALPRDDGALTTLVAGPVHEDATGVSLRTANGLHTDAQIFDAHDLQWFFAEIPGRRQIDAITATDVNGTVVDRLTLPRVFPDGGGKVIHRDGRPHEGPARVPDAADVPAELEQARGFSEFKLYYLGDMFRGLPLTSVSMGRPFDDPVERDWTFIYGTCTPHDGSEPSCSPPLQVQNWSICARFPARYTGHVGEAPETDLQHGARTLPAGGGLDVYTGRTAVAIFGPDKDAVIRSLKPLDQDEVPWRLPPPTPGSIEGRLDCQDKFVRPPTDRPQR